MVAQFHRSQSNTHTRERIQYRSSFDFQNGRQPLHLAALQKDAEIYRLLVNYGADVRALDAVSDSKIKAIEAESSWSLSGFSSAMTFVRNGTSNGDSRKIKFIEKKYAFLGLLRK